RTVLPDDEHAITAANAGVGESARRLIGGSSKRGVGPATPAVTQGLGRGIDEAEPGNVADPAWKRGEHAWKIRQLTLAAIGQRVSADHVEVSRIGARHCRAIPSDNLRARFLPRHIIPPPHPSPKVSNAGSRFPQRNR